MLPFCATSTAPTIAASPHMPYLTCYTYTCHIQPSSHQYQSTIICVHTRAPRGLSLQEMWCMSDHNHPAEGLEELARSLDWSKLDSIPLSSPPSPLTLLLLCRPPTPPWLSLPKGPTRPARPRGILAPTPDISQRDWPSCSGLPNTPRTASKSGSVLCT
ncbi:hypothetical protein DUNSADRAFT_9473 [Dunaliella salina]|uniref:Encoded protein n=1 Tax=Dunaliella salina TaxID=3046 RepID=A0ABQ7GEB3_DUNSA|nr:hypothetical protein DUNSADRAFT_9473 [Dunaliella salina]|eukprot:KAF5834034.1 hypothetical protein DUNSADRAFT_9473 [Dunaliella salina]